MFGWLGISAVNPALLWGGLAIASPILIHLLSKRKFKRVEWAAMDFLLQADRRNRRRIRLENLILLLLRCLAILLIAMLVSRLVLQPTGLASMLNQQARTERIILIDDSPSTRVRVGNANVFDTAKRAVIAFVRNLATERPGDTVTLLTTSGPTDPIRNDFPLEKTEDLVAAIDQLALSDVAADLDQALLAVEENIDEARAGGAGSINRVIYLITDLRQRDWTPAADTPEDRTIARILERLGEQSDGVVIVNMGDIHADNLAITDIRAREKSLVAGVGNRFEVTVKNFGTTEANDVKVTFTAGDAPPLIGFINAIPAGGVGSASFTFTFPGPGSYEVRAELEPDALPADNQRLLAARVKQGVKVLIVDGDPSADYRAESYFLARALDPRGQSVSGNVVEVLTENQFAAATLDDYQVIALCNVYQIPEPQRQALRRWVQAGGGLVVYLGDQVDDVIYNEQMLGYDLMPGALTDLRGDETERAWAEPTGEASSHPVMAMFAGTNNPLLSRVKVFQWWGIEPDEQMVAQGQVRVVSRLNDRESSALLVERSVGDGRVMLFTTTADADWTAWPQDASFVIAALEVVQYLAPTTTDEGTVRVGRALIAPIDVSRYQAEARVTPPGTGETTMVQAQMIDLEARGEAEDATVAAPDDAGPEPPAERRATMALRYDQTRRAGLYRVRLSGHDGSSRELLFAANIDPAEGDLAPMATDTLGKQLGESNVQLVDGEDYLDQDTAGGRVELWRTLAVLLLIVLCTEQFLAWTFGRRR